MAPAGTITHTARGFSSFATNSSSEVAPSAPSASSAFTASGRDVVADAAVAVLHQTPDDSGAHPAEADHSELHGGVRSH